MNTQQVITFSYDCGVGIAHPQDPLPLTLHEEINANPVHWGLKQKQ